MLLEALLDPGADIHAMRSLRMQLRWAAWTGDTAEVEALLQTGADAGAKDEDGTTPLHWAAVEGTRDGGRDAAGRRSES